MKDVKLLAHAKLGTSETRKDAVFVPAHIMGEQMQSCRVQESLCVGNLGKIILVANVQRESFYQSQS